MELRNTYYTFTSMKANTQKEKRNVHSYKCTDKAHEVALKRIKKEKSIPLANLIENWINLYGKYGSPIPPTNHTI